MGTKYDSEVISQKIEMLIREIRKNMILKKSKSKIF